MWTNRKGIIQGFSHKEMSKGVGRIRQGVILPPDHEHVRCTPQFLMKRIAQLTFRGVSVIFAGNAAHAAAIALRILYERNEELENERTRNEKCK